MNIPSFYRSIRPMVSSSSTFGDAFHVPVRKYHHLLLAKYYALAKDYDPLAKGYAETLPPSSFSSWETKPACVSKLSRNERPQTYEILGPGMILLRNYVSLENQIDIVNTCQKWGMAGGFYKPAELQRYIMCVGRNWDPETGYEKRYRACDDSEPPPLPQELISLAESAVQDAQTLVNPTELPSMRPDICLVNFYPTNGISELHQDCDESFDSLRRGLPVVYISIVEMAEFVYIRTRDESKLNTIYLKSGDVLIFGGKSRLIYHGVTQVAQYTSPLPLLDGLGRFGGHLSLTFRQF